MNKSIKIGLLSVVTLLFSLKGYADSPLTSTDFYVAYLDIPLVKAAADNPNVLTDEMMAYLYDDSNPLDVKMALINAVGWNADERLSTFPDYMAYCTNHFPADKERSHPAGIVTWEDVYNNASPDQWAVLVYLSAMADYSGLQTAGTLLEGAMQNSVNSESFMLPLALVWAQMKLYLGQWGYIYPSFQIMFGGVEVKDMRPEARRIINEYIDLYKEYAE